MSSLDSPDALSDLAHLIARCALKDQASLMALYDATSAKLYGVVLRILKREHWAEEVLQDIYLKVWHAADTYHTSRGRPMTWLINIARNRAIDFVRGAEHAAADRSEALPESLVSDLDPLRATETAVEMQRLARCLAGLSEAQRECVLLIYHQGYTPSEVASARRHPIGTVKTWIRRGLEQLRRCMHP